MHRKTIVVNGNVKVLEGPSQVWCLFPNGFLFVCLNLFSPLVDISIKGLSFYVMEMRKKMVATSQLKLLCVRKSSLPLVFSAQLERSNILSSTLLGNKHWELVLIFDIFYSLIYTQDSEPGPLVFDDQASSPRSPLTKKAMASKRKGFVCNDALLLDTSFNFGYSMHVTNFPQFNNCVCS